VPILARCLRESGIPRRRRREIVRSAATQKGPVGTTDNSPPVHGRAAGKDGRAPEGHLIYLPIPNTGKRIRSRAILARARPDSTYTELNHVAYLRFRSRTLRLLDEAPPQPDSTGSSIRSLVVLGRHRAQEQIQGINRWWHRKSCLHPVVVAGGYGVGKGDAIDQGRIIALDERKPHA